MPPPAAECKIPLDLVAVESGSIDDTTREKNKKSNLLQSIGKLSKKSLAHIISSCTPQSTPEGDTRFQLITQLTSTKT